MSRTTLFVDVIIPLGVPNLYTYRVPYEWSADIAAGKRVIVQFGKAKLYSALVRRVHETPPAQYSAKYIEVILDAEPIVQEKQFALWEWMSTYYMCSIGEVMMAALPGGLKLSSETRFVLHPDYQSVELEPDPAPDELPLELPRADNGWTDEEQLIVDALEVRNVLSISDVGEILSRKSVYPVMKAMIEKGLVLVQEEVREKFRPKMESFLRLAESFDNEDALRELFDKLTGKAEKQMEVLLAYIKLSGRYSEKPAEVKRSALIKALPGAEAALRALAKKGVFEIYEREVGRFGSYLGEQRDNTLNEDQQQIFDSIRDQFHGEKAKDVVLLHGVTSSGKTEIYVKLMQEVIASGRQVLYLLPEIALTTQIITRLRRYFGDKVGVYHSKFNEHERVEVWNNVLGRTQEGTPRYQLVVGARSALFLPFSDLGLVIVDEEHDSSFKQFDPAPRYNARDAAIYLSHIHHGKTLLGSATPSIESYYNALEGKYGFAELMKRFGGVRMPEIMIADVKEATKKKEMKSHFSPMLLNEISSALEQKEQVILFQNRRGFAPQLECNACAWVPQCINCDVSLTYHKVSNQLRCHYCGYSMPPPKSCGACGDTDLRMKGFGTEKIEEELQIFYPKARIMRMDLDTTRSKFAHQHIIHDFEEGNIDILVGTQMVTKGLDFDNVSMVGILNADSMLNFPDFRAYERSYQLMAQVSGRAGRKSKRGKVIIQTYNPDHSIIQDVWNNNYLSMYTNQLLDRRNFHYPPFYRLIEITVIHRDLDIVNGSANHLADALKKRFGNRILGPEFPLVSRIRNLYHKNILLKVERDSSVAAAKTVLNQELIAFRNIADFKTVRVRIDVDPM
jgi:primosomal protein N' (replication factor Y)